MLGVEGETVQERVGGNMNFRLSGTLDLWTDIATGDYDGDGARAASACACLGRRVRSAAAPAPWAEACEA